jgi:hypothetical protein
MSAKRAERILLKLWSPALVAGLLLIYGKLAWLDPVLERDDQHVLRFLKTWNEVKFLVSSGRWGELAAGQPVKDLSLRLDVWLSHVLGQGTFHWTNLVLWLLCCWVGLRVLEADTGPSLPRRIGMLLFAFHPIFVGSVGWISARKHLLSFLFILLATWEVLKLNGSRWRSLGWYLLALLSQPIHLLWPVWAFLRGRFVEKAGSERARRMISTAQIASAPLAAAGLANVLYYSGLYVTHANAEKWASETGPAISLLALGRYATNLLFPVRLATIYDPGSILGVAGLLALPAVLVFFRKIPKARLAVSWLVFALLPLAVVTARMTQIYVSDTYALGAGFGLLGACVLLWEALEPRGWRVPVAVSLAAAGLILLSREQAAFWRSDRALWEHAAKTEPTARARSVHARYLLEQGRVPEALEVLTTLHSMSADPAAVAYLDARIVAEDPTVRSEVKVKVLKTGADASSGDARAWSSYFLASVYARSGEFEQAFESMQRSLGAPSTFRQDLPSVVAEARYLCERAGRRDCALQTSDAQARITKTAGLYWDQRPYEDRLRELTRN